MRGHKADLFEGGHRVAFLAQWPGTIPPGTRCDQTICHTDLLATAAEIVDCDLPDQAGEDSVSILPLMKQPDHGPVREATVHHSINGSFSIRRGKWKLSFCPGSGGWSLPRPAEARKKKLPSLQLYDLEGDLAEEDNLQAEHVQLVDEMTGLLQSYIDKGRSTPGARQKNDRDVNFQSK